MRTWFRRVGRRVRALAFGEQHDAELTDEIRQHVELETEDLMRTRGLSRDEAHRQAMIGFGGVQRYREAQRDSRGVMWIEQLARDVKYAVRSLRKSPGFAITAIVTIALGIGATTAVYSVVNRLILHPLPFANESRVVLLDESWGGRHANGWLGSNDVSDWESRARSFEAMSMLPWVMAPLTHGHDQLAFGGAFVSPELLAAAGVRPLAGRLLVPADTDAGAAPVVLLSNRLWTRAFSGSTTAIGSRVSINDTSYTVVGVVPDVLEAMRGYMPTDFWIPMTSQERHVLARQQMGVQAAAVLKPGVRAERAAEELTTLARGSQQRRAGSTASAAPTVRLVEPNAFLDVKLETGVLIAFTATLLVLLIACANVANLQLLQAARRADEIAVRAALGASRWRLVRQLTVESTLLAILGGGAGVLLGWAGVHGIVARRPDLLTPLAVTQLDGRVLGFAFVATFATSLICGVVPALRVTRARIGDALRSVPQLGRPRARARLQSVVVIAEIAVTFVLLIGAGLPTRSLLKMMAVDPGFQADGLLELTSSDAQAKYADSTALASYWQRVVQRVRAVPSAVAVAPATNGMLQSNMGSAGFDIQVDEGANAITPSEMQFSQHSVSAEYFRVMGIRVLQGQPFSAEDERGETHARIVDSSFAAKLWPGESAVGKRYRPYWTGKPLPWSVVKGVVNDVGLVGLQKGLVAMQEYTPARQGDVGAIAGILVRVRPGTNASRALSTVKGVFASVDPDVHVDAATTENDLLAQALGVPRFVTTLLLVFAVLAMVLAGVGLYGVVAHVVTHRTHEIGVRIAMGARTADIFTMVLGSGLRLSLIGICIGLAVALGTTRLIGALLFRVSPTDPGVFGIISVILIGVAALASYLPARRAARVDPVIALRAE